MRKVFFSILALFVTVGIAVSGFAAKIENSPQQNIINTTEINTTEINTTTVNGVQIKDNVFVYVNAGTGNDTTGDGTSSKPYKTITKGLAEMVNWVSPNTMYLFIQDGTYTENINLPSELTGKLMIQGNLTTPDNVIVQAAGVGPVFNITVPAKVSLAGMKIQNATASTGVFADRADVNILYCKFFNNKNAVSSYNNSKVNFYYTTYGATSIDGNNISGSYGVISDFSSVLNIAQALNITNVSYGILNRTSALYVTSGLTIAANNYAVWMEKDAFGYFSGTQNFSTASTSGGRAIFRLSQCELDLISATLNMSTAYYGFYGSTGVNILATGTTYNYDNVTVGAYLDYDTVIDDPLSLSTTISLYAGAEKYALDAKFVSKIDYGFYRTPVDDVDYTLTSSDSIVAYTDLSATRTITIPNALRTSTGLTSGMVKSFMIIDEIGLAGTYPIVLNPEGGTLINGATTFSINRNRMAIHIYSDGTNWFVY